MSSNTHSRPRTADYQKTLPSPNPTPKTLQKQRVTSAPPKPNLLSPPPPPPPQQRKRSAAARTHASSARSRRDSVFSSWSSRAASAQQRLLLDTLPVHTHAPSDQEEDWWEERSEHFSPPTQRRPSTAAAATFTRQQHNTVTFSSSRPITPSPATSDLFPRIATPPNLFYDVTRSTNLWSSIITVPNTLVDIPELERPLTSHEVIGPSPGPPPLVLSKTPLIKDVPPTPRHSVWDPPPNDLDIPSTHTSFPLINSHLPATHPSVIHLQSLLPPLSSTPAVILDKLMEICTRTQLDWAEISIPGFIQLVSRPFIFPLPTHDLLSCFLTPFPTSTPPSIKLQSWWRCWSTRRKYVRLMTRQKAARTLWFHWTRHQKRVLLHHHISERYQKILALANHLQSTLYSNFSQITSKPHTIIHIPPVTSPHVEITQYGRIVDTLTRFPSCTTIYILPTLEPSLISVLHSRLSLSLAPSTLKNLHLIYPETLPVFKTRSSLADILGVSPVALGKIKEVVGGGDAYLCCEDEGGVDLSVVLGIPLLSPISYSPLLHPIPYQNDGDHSTQDAVYDLHLFNYPHKTDVVGVSERIQNRRKEVVGYIYPPLTPLLPFTSILSLLPPLPPGYISLTLSPTHILSLLPHYTPQTSSLHTYLLSSCTTYSPPSYTFPLSRARDCSLSYLSRITYLDTNQFHVRSGRGDSRSEPRTGIFIEGIRMEGMSCMSREALARVVGGEFDEKWRQGLLLPTLTTSPTLTSLSLL
ncbi:hypothetical protein DFS34DRAFT_332115 [Phlyctochytrium arcticum]|nr:hypothetical protein DFS34DRAFT_332115 [Phlyctochytrium arcticum]